MNTSAAYHTGNVAQRTNQIVFVAAVVDYVLVVLIHAVSMFVATAALYVVVPIAASILAMMVVTTEEPKKAVVFFVGQKVVSNAKVVPGSYSYLGHVIDF